jgi:transcriptional regulator
MIHGTLEMLILKALAREPKHGYAIAEFIHATSDEVLRVEEGALYPALHRLELRGLLASEWGTSENNRRAKFYQLTDTGKKQLASEARYWRRMLGAVMQVIESN